MTDYEFDAAYEQLSLLVCQPGREDEFAEAYRLLLDEVRKDRRGDMHYRATRMADLLMHQVRDQVQQYKAAAPPLLLDEPRGSA